MKRIPDQKYNSTGTTPEVNNKLQVKENSHLFNCIDKLAADHDVYVSNTMIKVTYKKALMDQSASDNVVHVSSKKVFNKGMNHSELSKKKKKYVKNMDLGSSDISFITKSPKVHLEGTKAVSYHSNQKPKVLGNEKKKKYVNGLNLSVKGISKEEKNSPAKVPKSLSSQDNASSPKKSKTSIKPEVSKRFLMNNNSLVKTKAGVIQRNNAEAKKVSLNKMENKKLKKLENCVKKKIDVDKKGLKRKHSNIDFNVSTKKIKISENKMKKETDSRKFEERYKMGAAKKQIMLVDPDLPAGWTRYIRTKNKGSANEQYVVYVVNPLGKKFRFKWKLRKYLERTNSSLDVDRFFFGLYQRPKSLSSSGVHKSEESKKNSVPVSGSKASNRSESPTKRNASARSSKQDEGSSNDSGKNAEGKELLLYDPDLPFGWKRVIHSDISSGKKQVHIISPDGKIFRRRYRLNEYLMKHQYTHNLDRFYFGLYPKKEAGVSENSGRESGEKTLNSVKSNNHINNKSVRKGSNSGKIKPQGQKDTVNYRSPSGNRQLRLILKKIDESGGN